MGDLMAKYRAQPYRGKFNTPTDAVSHKVFDRYKDQQVRHRVQLLERIREVERELIVLTSMLKKGKKG